MFLLCKTGVEKGLWTLILMEIQVALQAENIFMSIEKTKHFIQQETQTHLYLYLNNLL